MVDSRSHADQRMSTRWAAGVLAVSAPEATCDEPSVRRYDVAFVPHHMLAVIAKEPSRSQLSLLSSGTPGPAFHDACDLLKAPAAPSASVTAIASSQPTGAPVSAMRDPPAWSEVPGAAWISESEGPGVGWGGCVDAA